MMIMFDDLITIQFTHSLSRTLSSKSFQRELSKVATIESRVI